MVTGSGAPQNRPDESGNSTDVLVVIQARMGSTRLPGKVLLQLRGKTVLEILHTRLQKSALVDHIVLAVPDSPASAPLVEEGARLGIDVRVGPDQDVFNRFKKVIDEYEPSHIVRITADCPLVDWVWVDTLISEVTGSGTDYGWVGPDFPDGLDAECFSRNTFERLDALALTRDEREHVTMRVWREDGIRKVNLNPGFSGAQIRLTLDEPEDYEVLQAVCEKVNPTEVTAEQLVSLYRSNPKIFEPNKNITRDEGSRMGKGKKLWKRAERAIAGGNMLLSKHPGQFGSNNWPVYFEKAQGVRVTDLDGREFLDFGLMGVGTNILGYGHPIVDQAVQKAIAWGNMSSLNCKEEVLLAEELLRLHPWSDKARFTRSGGEAGALAVRIARAASGKPDVAVCGYHGWHDWYLSANLEAPDSINEMHLPGLGTAGIPEVLSGTTTTFAVNDLDRLRERFSTHNLGAVVMEVERNIEPAPGFLEGVRDLCTEHGAVLIFDECSSGFRNNLGGLHLQRGVNPDLCILGKTLGNGYAINALLGTDSVMAAIHKTFVSSTFWSERIGSVAGLATLQVMEQQDAPARITEIGKRIRKIWTEAGAAHGLEVEVLGLPALSNFQIQGIAPSILKSVLVEQFLKKGFLAGPYFFASLAHTDSLISKYEAATHEIFEEISLAHVSGSLSQLVDGGPAGLGISRIN